jgi:tripartite-type tricarboxylate transporter receptor subunit TctC
VIDVVYKELSASLKDPAIQKKMSDMGVVPGGNTPAEFAIYLAKERDTYKDLALKTGLKIE